MKRLFKKHQDSAARPHARRPFAGHLSARLFLCLFLLLCCAGGLRGQEYLHRLETAIDMGTYDGSFTYRDSVDTSEYGDDFSLPEEKFCPPAEKPRRTAVRTPKVRPLFLLNIENYCGKIR